MRDYFVWLAKLITILVLVILVIPAMAGLAVGLFASKEMLQVKGGKTVAVIELKGEISDSKEVIEELHTQAAEKKIKGIVLRIDSPGGSVGPSQEIYAAVKTLKSKKPIVASFGSTAASGGLYSALSASKIFCQPGTVTGSIGVIMQIPNFTNITEKVGFQMVTIKSGKLKDVGNPFRPVTPDEEAFLQTTVSSIYKDFVTAVSESRGIPEAEVIKFADGRVITGTQAKELKLVDGYGDVYTAAREALALNNITLNNDEMPELYYPGDKLQELKKLSKYLGSLINKTFGMTQGIQFKYLM